MNKFLRVIAIAICISLVLVCLSSCTTNANYFTFEPNSDETGYIITGTAKILPDKVVLPNKYQGKPVVKASIESKTVKQLTISSNIVKIRLNCNSLETIKLEKDSEHFTMKDKVLFTKDLTRIVFVLPTKKDHFIIPRTIIAAEQWAFSCANIKVMYVPIEYLDYSLSHNTANEFDNLLWNDKDYNDKFFPLYLYNNEITINLEANSISKYENISFAYYTENSIIHWGVTIPV